MAFFPDYNDMLKEKFSFLAMFIVGIFLLSSFGYNISSAFVTWLLTMTVLFCGWIWIMRSRKLNPNGKAVIISGCNSGFGHATARALHGLGFTVYAGCTSLDKSREGVTRLREMKSDRMHLIQLDVTSENSVQQAVQYVTDNLPENSNGLWAVINNAGISELGYLENTPHEIVERMMSVNFFGPIRMTKAFLPLLQKARGRIVNVCSLNSLIGMAVVSAYCASKYAIHGFSECIRQELSPTGVRVISIYPGNFMKATNVLPISKIKEIKRREGKPKDDDEITAVIAVIANGNGDITEVVDSMVDSVHSTYPATNYIPGSILDKVAMLIAGFMPSCISDFLFAKGTSFLALLSQCKLIKLEI